MVVAVPGTTPSAEASWPIGRSRWGGVSVPAPW